MKKVYIFIVLGFMLGVSVHAKSQEPQYKIIANSNQESDIKEMYEVKGKLLEDYQATYKQGVYKIVLGKGKGKSLSGEMKVNYCESTKDIETKSFLFDWLF